MNRYCFYCCY